MVPSIYIPFSLRAVCSLIMAAVLLASTVDPDSAVKSHTVTRMAMPRNFTVLNAMTVAIDWTVCSGRRVLQSFKLYPLNNLSMKV